MANYLKVAGFRQTATPNLGEFLTFGGKTTTMAPDTYAYLGNYNAWAVRALMPSGRFQMAYTRIGDDVYTFGGDRGSLYGLTNETLRYRPSQNSWVQRQARTQGQAWNFAAGSAGAINGKAYVTGGYNVGELDKTDEYDPATNSWTGKQAFPVTRMFMAGAVLADLFYCVAGVSGGSPTIDVRHYDPSSNTWIDTANPGAGARRSMASYSTGSVLLASGGYLGVTTYDRVFKFTPPSTWAITGVANMPLATAGHAAVEYDGNMVLSCGGLLAEGANYTQLYNIGSNSWTQLMQLPGPRQYVAAGSLG